MPLKMFKPPHSPMPRLLRASERPRWQETPPPEKSSRLKKTKGLFFLWLLDNPRALSSSEQRRLSCKGHTARQHAVTYSHRSQHSPYPKLQLSSLR